MEQNLQIIDLQVAQKDDKPSIDPTPILIDLTNKKEEETKFTPIELTIPKKIEEESDVVSIEIINTKPDSSFNMGYDTQIPITKLETAKENHFIIPECPQEDSMMDTIKPGFGIENILRRECKKPKYKQHLCKENYLSEFEAETEKQLARTNLGIYSKQETDSLLEKLIEAHSQDFVTHSQVEKMIADLDFVDSNLKAVSNYEIPETLFKL